MMPMTAIIDDTTERKVGLCEVVTLRGAVTMNNFRCIYTYTD